MLESKSHPDAQFSDQKSMTYQVRKNSLQFRRDSWYQQPSVKASALMECPIDVLLSSIKTKPHCAPQMTLTLRLKFSLHQRNCDT